MRLTDFIIENNCKEQCVNGIVCFGNTLFLCSCKKLTEANIKIPQNAYKIASQYVLDYFYRYLFYKMNKTYSAAKNLDRRKQTICFKLGIDETYSHTTLKPKNEKHKISIVNETMPASYVKKNAIYKFFNLYIGKALDNNEATFTIDNKIAKIYIAVDRFVDNNIHNFFENPDSIKRFIVKLEQNLKHELQHFVQYSYLSNYTNKYKEDEYNLGNLSNDNEKLNFYTSETEFAPLITTAFEHIKEAIDSTRDKKHINDIIKTFCDIEQTQNSKKYGITGPYEFFSFLKKKNPNAWKKAVKIFVKEIQNYIDK